MIIENGVVRKIGPADIPENGELIFPDGARKIRADVTKLSEQDKQKVMRIDFNNVKEIDCFKTGKVANKSGNVFCKEIGKVFPNVKFIEAAHLERVNSGCFSSMNKLKCVNIRQATTIGKNAFLKCKSLTRVMITNVMDIGEGAFSGCSSLLEIIGLTFRNAPYATNLKAIQDHAFADAGIEGIIIPNNAKIHNNAFINSKLKEVYISNLENLEEFSFYGCNQLEKVHIKGISESPESIKFPWVKDGYRYLVYDERGLEFTRNVVCASMNVDGKVAYRGISYIQQIDVDGAHTLYIHSADEGVMLSATTSSAVTVRGLKELEYALNTF